MKVDAVSGPASEVGNRRMVAPLPSRALEKISYNLEEQFIHNTVLSLRN